MKRGKRPTEAEMGGFTESYREERQRQERRDQAIRD